MTIQNATDIKRVAWMGRSIVIEYTDGDSIIFRKDASHLYKWLDVWEYEDHRGTHCYYRCRSDTPPTRYDGIATLARSLQIEGNQDFAFQE